MADLEASTAHTLEFEGLLIFSSLSGLLGTSYSNTADRKPRDNSHMGLRVTTTGMLSAIVETHSDEFKTDCAVVAEHAREVLLGRDSRCGAYLELEAVGRLLAEHGSGRRNLGHHLWALLVFEHWLRAQ